MDEKERSRTWHSTVSERIKICTRRATPALFAITMGTGAVSTLFEVYPYGADSRPMRVFCLMLFFLNLCLFTLFCVLVIGKYICYPEKWRMLVDNPVTSLYAGTFPMGGTTLINVAVLVVHGRYGIGGKGLLYFLWAMWWLDIVVAFMCCWIGVHVMFTHQKHTMSSMTAMWLLPVVTLIVAATSGGIISKALLQYSDTYAFNTVVVSTFMCTVGLTLALMILTIYLARLIVHGLPTGGSILSVFLPLGPTGQAGFAVMLLGENYSQLLPQHIQSTGSISNSATGIIVDIVCTCLSFVLWSVATMWIVYALLALRSSLRKSIVTFRVSFWGLVFPNAVYSNLTIAIGRTFNSPAFRVYGAIYAAATLVLWTTIFFRSIWELRTFFAIREISDNITIPEIDESQMAGFQPSPEASHPDLPRHLA